MLGLGAITVFLVAIAILRERRAPTVPHAVVPNATVQLGGSGQAPSELDAPPVIASPRKLGSGREDAAGERTPGTGAPRKSDVVLSPDEEIRGIVRLEGKLPAGEVVEVTLTAHALGLNDGTSLAYLTNFHVPMDQSCALESALMRPDGTFALPKPRSAPAGIVMSIHAHGDLVSSTPYHFMVDGYQDPGAEPIEISASVGGHLTLQFELPDDATAQERQSLVGKTVQLLDSNPRGQMFPSYWEMAARSRGVIDEQLRLIIPGLPVDAGPIVFPDPSDARLGLFAPFYALSPVWMLATGESFKVTDKFWWMETGKRAERIIPLVRGDLLRGQVFTSTGEPVRGATVVAHQGERMGRPAIASHARETDVDGRFEFIAIPKGTTTLAVSVEGLPDLVLSGDARLKALEDPEHIKLYLSAGATLFGQVIAPGDSVADRIRVRIQPAGSGADRASHRFATTDRTGRFEVEGLTTDEWTASVTVWRETSSPFLYINRRKGRDVERLDAQVKVHPKLTSENAPLLLELALAPVLSGRVVDATGNSQAAYRVFQSRAYALQPELFAQRANAKQQQGVLLSTSDLSFSIDVGYGPVALWAETGSAVDSRSSPLVVVDVDADVNGLELVLPDLGSAYGQVIDESGHAVWGAFMTALRLDDTGRDQVRRVMSDADGEFALQNLPPGRYAVVMRHTNLAALRPMEIKVEAGRDLPGLVVQAVEGGTVELDLDRLYGLSGLRPIRVTVESPSGLPIMSAEDDRTSLDHIGPLGPGPAVIKVHITDADSESERLIRREVTIVRGETKQLSLQPEEIRAK